MITKVKVLKVVELFETVLPDAQRDEQLNMSVGVVNMQYECGSVHCHAGWFAVALLRVGLLKGKVDFDDGAKMMAEILGFKDDYSLEKWAKVNSEKWGNRDGGLMFYSTGEKSFYHPTKRPNGAENLKHIVDHWKEVAERL